MKEDRIITDVSEGKTYWCISASGCGFRLDKSYGVTPHVGDTVTIYVINGSMVRGMDINGKRVFYKSDEELEQEHQVWVANYKKEKQECFEQNKAQLDADYECLPDNFKKRIDRFRRNNPNFRVDNEAYEMFVCKEALKIAAAIDSADGIYKFNNASWEEQQRLVPDISDGHSGNTFGMACRLAQIQLVSPERVWELHGALSVIVGSKEYGDIAPEDA